MKAWCLVMIMSGASWAAGPKAVFPEREHDFGSFAEGAEKRHDFPVRNEGDAPLSILKVRSSCGCTAAAASAEPIAPGKSGKIRVSYDSKGRPGDFRKDVIVTTDDPAAASVSLRISGKVLPAGPGGPPAPAPAGGCEAEVPCGDDPVSSQK